eukprot:887600-Amphidinium_carterae.1
MPVMTSEKLILGRSFRPPWPKRSCSTQSVDNAKSFSLLIRSPNASDCCCTSNTVPVTGRCNTKFTERRAGNDSANWKRLQHKKLNCRLTAFPRAY